MGKLLRKCVECGRYTMVEGKCPQCGGVIVSMNPPRFSLVDKYGKYRREVKKRQEKRG